MADPGSTTSAPTPVIVSVPPTEPGSADLPEGSGDSTTTTVDPGADTVVAPIEPGDGTDVAPAAPGDDSPLTTTPAATEPPTNDPDVVELPSAPTGGWPLRSIASRWPAQLRTAMTGAIAAVAATAPGPTSATT